MELEHRFTVPTSVGETWAIFDDIAGVAECFPGATVTSADGDSFTGSVKVKLGPIALVYGGSGTFTEKDEQAHRFVVDAKGKDKRGNGTAGARVTLAMAAGDAGTDVHVHTDLTITGKPAQFGRGVVQDVSDKLLGKFIDCLEQRLGGADAEPAPASSSPPMPPPVPEPPDPPPAPTPAAPTPPAPHASGGPPAGGRPSPPPYQADDAIDLGATAVPALLRAYGRQIGVAIGGILLVRWLLRRRR